MSSEHEQRILDEDAYVDALEHIIGRDFYPDLHTANTAKHHDEDGEHKEAADDAADLVHYVNSEILSEAETQSMQSLSLAQFQQRYTSEDNASFNEILRHDQIQHSEKFPWIAEQQTMADERQRYVSMLRQQQSAIQAPSHGEHAQPRAIEFEGGTAAVSSPDTTTTTTVAVTAQDARGNNVLSEDDQNQLRESAQSVTERLVNAGKQQHQRAQNLQAKVDLYRGELQYWKFNAVNNLMFFPSVDADSTRKRQQAMQLYHGKAECNYDNTRLPHTFALSTTTSQTQLQPQNVDMLSTPLIKPGHAPDGVVDGSNVEHSGTPITTWGELGATPLRLHDDDGPQFRIARLPKRDRMVHALNQKTVNKLRKKQEERLRNTTPSSQSILRTTEFEHGVTTPLVGMQGKRSQAKLQKLATVGQSRNAYSSRSIHDLSPAARKLMQQQAMSSPHRPRLSTPLASALRDVYSSTTPNRNNSDHMNHRKRKRSNASQETPTLVVQNTDSKKRKLHDNLQHPQFERPVRSLRHSSGKHTDTHDITDGLL